MAFANLNSLLAADIGSVNTRLVLIDRVEGQYRLVASASARTTAEPPLATVGLGVERAIQQITDLIGRRLLDQDPENMLIMPEREGQGVDEFVVTSSAGRPMRAVLVGVTPEISMLSGRRVLAGSYISVVETLCPDDVRSEQDQINALLATEPDLILIVGGTDDGAAEILLEQVKKVQTALSLVTRGTLPIILYAGNPALRPQVKALLNPLTTVFTAANVRPSLADEQLFPAQLELALVYDDYQSRTPGKFNQVGRHSQVGVVPTTQGYISVARYLGTLPTPGDGALIVDVGSANSVIAASLDGAPHVGIRTDLGVGHHMLEALETVTLDNLRQWLPFEIGDDALWDYAHNKRLRPATIPGTPEDLMIETGLAREILRTLVASQRPAWRHEHSELLPRFNPIIAAGAVLTQAPHPGLAALLLLDALQPVGVTELLLDPHNLVSAAGVMAYLNPLVTVQALETGGLTRLGTAFCPLGHIRAGQDDALTLHIRPEEGLPITRRLKGGDLWLAPLLPGIHAEVEIRLRRGLTINGRRRIKQRVETGAAGIIFDVRGRPLTMPRARDRAARLMAWQFAMSGRDPVEVPDAASALEAALPDLDALVSDPLTGVPMPRDALLRKE